MNSHPVSAKSTGKRKNTQKKTQEDMKKYKNNKKCTCTSLGGLLTLGPSMVLPPSGARPVVLRSEAAAHPEGLLPLKS